MEWTNCATLSVLAASRKLSLRGGKGCSQSLVQQEKGGLRSSRSIHTLVRAPENQSIRWRVSGKCVEVTSFAPHWVSPGILLSCCYDASLSAANSQRDIGLLFFFPCSEEAAAF